MLTATVIYTEELTIAWYRGNPGVQIDPNSQDYTIEQTYPNGSGDFKYTESTLTINGLNLANTEEFYAESFVTLPESGTQTVRSDPIEVISSKTVLTDGVAKAGDTVTLYCAFRGTTSVNSVSLLKLGENNNWDEVNLSSTEITNNFDTVKASINEMDATYIAQYQITGMGNGDVGKYKCIVEEDSHSFEIESEPNSVQLLSQSISATKMLLEIGDTAYITCTFTGLYEPEVTFQVFGSNGWAKDDNAYLNSLTSTSTIEGGTVKITSVAVYTKLVRQTTAFRFRATFQDPSRPSQETFILSEQAEIMAASIELGTHKQSLDIYVGAAFTFICQYKFETTGSVVAIAPTPGNSDTYSTKDSSGVTTGYINGLFGTYDSPKTVGPFACQIQIEGLTLTKSVSLNVIAVPDPSALVLEQNTIQEGDYDWFTCSVTSNMPVYTVSWYTVDNAVERYVATERYFTLIYSDLP